MCWELGTGSCLHSIFTAPDDVIVSFFFVLFLGAHTLVITLGIHFVRYFFMVEQTLFVDVLMFHFENFMMFRH